MPDRAYTNQPAVNKSVPPFELTPQRRVTKKHLRDWAPRAYLQLTEWTQTLTARARRWWDDNGNYGSGAHVKERWARERRLKRNTARLTKTRGYAACAGLPLRERAEWRALMDAAELVLGAGDWWKLRAYPDPKTGEIKHTVYCPEAAWSAETLIAWCVRRLDHLLGLVGWTTEKKTPSYKPGEADIRRTHPGRAVSVAETLAFLAEVERRRTGAQPELPATS